MKTFITAAVAGALVLAGSTAFAQDAAAGKKAFADQKCTTCHQAQGVGAKLYVLDGVAKKLTAAEIRSWLTNTAAMEAKLPKKPPVLMSSFLKLHKLSAGDVDSLVAYLETLK